MYIANSAAKQVISRQHVTKFIPPKIHEILTLHSPFLSNIEINDMQSKLFNLKLKRDKFFFELERVLIFVRVTERIIKMRKKLNLYKCFYNLIFK